MNRGGVLPARWSPDSTLVLWEVEGRFSPDALVLLKVEDNRLAWQVDVLKIVQQAILVRTDQVEPTKYATAKKWNEGSGSAYPDGFTVNVRAEGDKERGGLGEDVTGKPISLPLRVHAELTSDPKGVGCPKDAQLDTSLDGVIDPAGKLTVKLFRLRAKPFTNATATSWLELTNSAAAVQSPLEYGDMVSLEGKVMLRKDEAAASAYFLALSRRISVPASTDSPAENDISEVRLLGMEAFKDLAMDGNQTDTYKVYGTLGHADLTNQRLALTLKVHGWSTGD